MWLEWFIKRQLCSNPLHLPCSGMCETAKAPNGSSCSACFLNHVVAACESVVGQHALQLGQPRENMENHLVNLHVFVFSRLQYFFLFSLLFLSFLLVTVLVLFCYSFYTLSCISSFLLLRLHSIFFLILSFGSPLFSTLLIKSIACVPLFSLFPFLFSFPFSQTFSFSQHWNTGGSHPEELEWPGAHPRLKTRSQPPLFHPLISSEPQFTDCVALPEHSIPGDQIALQMIIITKYS